jgi:hypothetical protein
VATAQVAPAILRLLGVSPDELQAVQKEHTKPLPLGGDFQGAIRE